MRKIARQNIVRMAAEAIEQNGNASAYTCMGTQLTFHQLGVQSDAFAHWLRGVARLRAGDRVALMLPNILQYPVVALGVLKAHGIIVNVNPQYTSHELQRILLDSGARVLVVLANVAHNAAAVLGHSSVEHVVVTQVGDMLGWARGTLINLMVRHVKRMVKPHQFQFADSLRIVLRQGAKIARLKAPISQEIDADAVALLQYTGGTTGVMKAAMLSHSNLLNNVEQLRDCFGVDMPPLHAVMVAPLPLYHIYAFNLNLLLSLQCGHHALLIPNPRDVGGFVSALRRVKMSGFVGINTLYRSLLIDRGFQSLDFSSLTIAASGGMPLSPQVAADWLQLTGKPILEGYGLTECSPMVACNTYRNSAPGSVGKLACNTEIRLTDASGKAVASGEAGEICIKGPQVMQGYWRNPTETARVLDAEGWLHTGDVGRIDDEGFLFIVDRIKDIIVVSGFNVYPTEVEEYACRHPDIVEACAVGVGDPLAPLICLFVVSRDPTLTVDAVLAHCRGGLTAYKRPKLVEFRNSLPKSAVGKLLRRELQTIAAESV